MIEPLHGNDWLVDGEVRSADDLLDWQPEDDHDDALEDDVAVEVAKNKLLHDDEEIMDGIISDIHPHRVAKRPLGRTAVENIRLDSEARTDAPAEPPISHAAQEILTQYREEKTRLEQYKRKPDMARLRRNVWIAIIRNYQDLSADDRHYIEAEAGLTEHHGKPVPPSDPPARDWREKQFKD